LKTMGIILGLLLLVLWATSGIPNFSATILNYSFNIPNVFSQIGAIVLTHVLGLDITISIVFLIVAVLLLVFGFLA
jgi:hypothetical protein